MKTNAIKYLNALVTDNTTKKEIDLIDYIKKCVREYKTENKAPEVDWLKYFQKLWELYPRKVNKELAKRTFEHKIRGLNEEDCKEKCRKIYQMQSAQVGVWKEKGTEMQFIPHFSTWLNASIPNSKYYKGK